MTVALKGGCYCGRDDDWANAAECIHAARGSHLPCKACEGWPERSIVRMSRENAVFVAESSVAGTGCRYAVLETGVMYTPGNAA